MVFHKFMTVKDTLTFLLPVKCDIFCWLLLASWPHPRSLVMNSTVQLRCVKKYLTQSVFNLLDYIIVSLFMLKTRRTKVIFLLFCSTISRHLLTNSLSLFS